MDVSAGPDVSQLGMEAPQDPDRRDGRAFYAAAGDEPAVFRFERLDPPNYRVMEPFDYVDHQHHWYRVPVDTEDNMTDFASIPFFLTWLVPKDGTHTPAAVLHDALIGGKQGVHYETSLGRTVPDHHADYLFREAMAASGVSWLRRWLMWAAVALRSLTIRIDKDERTGEEEQNVRWWRIAIIGAAILAWAVLSAGMALDVPDLLAADRDLPWLGDRSFVPEVLIALLMVACGTAAITVVFSIALGIGRDVESYKRGAAAGAIGGVVVGFLGLPMIASLVGAAGYWVLDRLAALRYPDRVQETAGGSLGERA